MQLVLVVDESAIVREPLAAALGAAGYRTSTAGDGVSALASARQDPPDLILIDLAMPMALATLREMRASAAAQAGLKQSYGVNPRRGVVIGAAGGQPAVGAASPLAASRNEDCVTPEQLLPRNRKRR